MQDTSEVSRPSSSKLVWVGRIVSALPVLGLIMSAWFKFSKAPEAVEGMGKFGWSEDMLLTLGIIEVACTIIYLVPQTAVLGAILLTGYLGGATATHVRIEDPFMPPLIMGVLVWLGIYLRDARLRELIPLRRV